MESIVSVFQDLYDSEINFTISTFWDGWFTVRLGDEMNGFRSETNVERWSDIEPWLTVKATKLFPHTRFARMYHDNLSVWPDQD